VAEWLSEVAVGQWFRSGGESFEIVGIDVPSELVLVQYFDGTLEEFDFETWTQLAAQPCAAPEDYSGALDLDPEDYDEIERDAVSVRNGRWDSPLDRIDLDDF